MFGDAGAKHFHELEVGTYVNHYPNLKNWVGRVVAMNHPKYAIRWVKKDDDSVATSTENRSSITPITNKDEIALAALVFLGRGR